VNLFAPILSGLVASAAALAGSGLILALGPRAERAATWLLSYAIGTLLGAATLALLPEALAQAPVDRVMAFFLAGMLGFVAFERGLRWRHPHEHHPVPGGEHRIEHATALMVLWGDALHNFVDGMVIGVSYGVSLEVGIGATLAIVAHEVPQEIGDFAVLLGSGMARRRAVLLNWLSGLAVLPGVLFACAWLSRSAELSALLLPIAAGGFVYIALADLVPALQHRRGGRAGLAQLALVAAGAATLWAIGQLHG
jgi:zinc and cadmium transporter